MNDLPLMSLCCWLDEGVDLSDDSLFSGTVLDDDDVEFAVGCML